MLAPKRVHAVTIHHRGREMLDVCLKTLLASTGVDLEIIVVLNGCDEELPEVAHESPKVHVTTTGDPVGFSEANNIGVKWARTHLGEPDHYYFVNNDTRSTADALERQVAAIDDEENAAVAGPMLIIDWAPDYLNSLCLRVTEDAWAWDDGIGLPIADVDPLPGRRRVIAVTGSAMLVAAAAFNEVGGWTELYDYYFEDIDLCLKIREAGYEVIHEPAAVVGHHVSATMTLESDHKHYLFWRNRLLLAMVHWPAGLLYRLFKTALVWEIFRRPRAETGLQRRAFWGAMRKLPKVIPARWRRGHSSEWSKLLEPVGSVPVIALPEKPPELLPDAPPESTEDADHRGGIAPAPPGPRRLLVLGVSPLPFESTEKSFGPGTRTWQLVEPLLEDGHEITLIGMRIPDTYPPDTPPEVVHRRGKLCYASIAGDVYSSTSYVRNTYECMQPDAVVFAHGSASYEPDLLDSEVPVWIDLCGHVMAEAQAKAGVYHDDSFVDYFYKRVLGSLFAGDAYSTVSEAQKYALIGELGLAGRLNSRTNGHDLIHTIPCGAEEEDYRHDRTVLRGIDVDDGDFVVLWSGGFNTWTDVDTMFAGLELAMEQDPSIRFVATGGQINGHDEITYPRFRSMIDASRHRDKFILKGWLPRDLVHNFYFEADVGINCEKDIYEVRLGSKHRILDWSRAALPVVSTRVTELSLAVEEEGVGFICDPGDAEALGDAILEASGRRDELADMGERCRQAMRRRFGFQASTEELRRWAASPAFAPDRGRKPIGLEAMMPVWNEFGGRAVTGATAFHGESRIQWLRRVVRKSYEDGGAGMVVKRACCRFCRRSSVSG